jgi:hypothetical protein
MIGVTMRQDQSQEAWIGCLDPGNLGQKRFRVVVPGIERQAEVEQDALSLACQLDARPTNLARAAVNANAEALGSCLSKNGSDAHTYSFT